MARLPLGCGIVEILLLARERCDLKHLESGLDGLEFGHGLQANTTINSCGSCIK